MITNIRSGRERHSSAVLRFRNGSIIDASDDRNRSRRVRIFPLLITCPNWSITLITVSYGGEASRNDKISPLFPSPHQALFHPRVIPTSPETVWTCTFATKRNLSPAGKNQPRFREEENGGPGHRGDGRGHRSHAPSAASRPRPLSDFPFLALRFPLHRPTPSLSKQRSGLASLPLPPSPPPTRPRRLHPQNEKVRAPQSGDGQSQSTRRARVE